MPKASHGGPCLSISLPCSQLFLSDLHAREGCSKRPWVPCEIPVPEPLAPDGMGSGIGLRSGFHRGVETTPAGSRKVKFRLSLAYVSRRLRMLLQTANYAHCDFYPTLRP